MMHWTEDLYKKKASVFATLFEERSEQVATDVGELLHVVAEEQGFTPERILDVACGTGSHVLAFATRGVRAEGVDFSEAFIERAEERAAERGLADEAEFHVGDMRELDEWEGSYDLVTSFWNSLGYYDKRTDVAILQDIKRLLSERGTLVIEMSNKEFYVRNFESSHVDEVDDQLHVTRKEFDVSTGRFHTTVDVFSTEGDSYEYLETMEFQPRIYAPVELKEMCEKAGFEEISMFGSFDGKELTLDSSQVVLLAA